LAGVLSRVDLADPAVLPVPAPKAPLRQKRRVDDERPVSRQDNRPGTWSGAAGGAGASGRWHDQL